MFRGLVRCGHCGISVACHQRPALKNTDTEWNRYYYCRNHDPLRAGGEHRRCPERNIRADALDTFVFGPVRAALLQPEVLLAGEHAVTARTPMPDDEIVAQQLARLDRKTDAVHAEHRRLIDLYQADLIDLAELRRRSGEIDQRRRSLENQRQSLIEQHRALTKDNQIRSRIAAFAERVAAALDDLNFDQRQSLLRLVVEDVQVSGWNIQIRLRIPLDDDPDAPSTRQKSSHPRVSSEDRLRSLRSTPR